VPIVRPAAQVVDFQVQQTFLARSLNDTFVQRSGEHGRKQSEHVNFHRIILILFLMLILN